VHAATLAGTIANDEHRPHNAYAHVGYQPGEGKRQAKSQYDRPRCRGRQLQHLIGNAGIFVRIIH
jgi:hypothetical protein